MALSNTEFEQEARQRVTRFLDNRGYGSHDARLEDERVILGALGIAVTPPLIGDETVNAPDAFDGDGPADPDLDDDLTV